MASEQERGDGGEGQLQFRPDEPMHCYNCATLLPDDRRHCPGCGRSLFRTCYCGANIPVTYMTCPNCNADWSQSARVRKKKSHSRTIRTAQVGGYALAGAVCAVLFAALAETIISALASRSLADGGGMPAGLLDRLVLAAQTILAGVGSIWGFLSDHAMSLLGFLLILLAGAAAGAAYYIVIVRQAHTDHRDKAKSRNRENRVRRRRA